MASSNSQAMVGLRFEAVKAPAHVCKRRSIRARERDILYAPVQQLRKDHVRCLCCYQADQAMYLAGMPASEATTGERGVRRVGGREWGVSYLRQVVAGGDTVR